MPETREKDPMRHAAAAAYRRIDRDLGTVPEAVVPMLRLIRSNLFEQSLSVDRIRDVLDLRSEIAARVGYRRYKTWHDAFRRRMGCQPKVYRETGGLPDGTPAAGAGESADAAVEPGLPRFLAGIAELPLDSSCVRCGSGLPPGPAARVFEDLDPLCDLCALEHPPRELADFLFVNAPHRKRQPKELLDRITEPEKILAGAVGEIFELREEERKRRLSVPRPDYPAR